MKPSTHDKVEGALHEIKGKAKEAAGRVTDSPKLTAEGRVEQVAATVQKKVGDIKRVFEK